MYQNWIRYDSTKKAQHEKMSKKQKDFLLSKGSKSGVKERKNQARDLVNSVIICSQCKDLRICVL